MRKERPELRDPQVQRELQALSDLKVRKETPGHRDRPELSDPRARRVIPARPELPVLRGPRVLLVLRVRWGRRI